MKEEWSSGRLKQSSKFNFPIIYSLYFQAEDGIRDLIVPGVQTCALPICLASAGFLRPARFGHAITFKRLHTEVELFAAQLRGLPNRASHQPRARQTQPAALQAHRLGLLERHLAIALDRKRLV